MVPKARTHSEAMQLQSLGKLTRHIKIITSVFPAALSLSLFAARSITNPHASDHITLVWLSTFPPENGMNERQPLKSFEAKMYAKCDITANANSRAVYLSTSRV